jgi:XisI protein
MDRTERYRVIVRRVIEEYARYTPSHGQIETEAVVDREHDHYEVMHVGWDGVRRVHGCVIHLDIRGGKVWVQYDGTSRPVAEELVDAGIPREDIVLGFHPAELRRHTAFARD